MDRNSTVRYDSRRGFVRTTGAAAFGVWGGVLGVSGVGERPDAGTAVGSQQCTVVPIDVVLVLDRSGSMEGQKLAAAQRGAQSFVSRLDGNDRVALVSFADSASVDVGLTGSHGQVDAAIDGLVASGGTNMTDGVQRAQGLLANGRSSATPVVVVLGDGEPASPGNSELMAERAKGAGTRVLTIAYGADADESLLRRMAARPASANAFVAGRDSIGEVFQTVAQEVCMNVVSIESERRATPVEYQFSVSGSLEHTTADGGTKTAEDVVFGNLAYGWTNGGTDSYALSGNVTAFHLNPGPGTVRLNGTEVDPSRFPDLAPGGSGLPNTVSIESRRTDNPVEYQFSVSGSLEHSAANGATLTAEDIVVGDTAYSWTNGATDSYAFSGEIITFERTSGPATVRLNGRRVDTSQFPSRSVDTGLPHTISISAGRVENDPVEYQFRVSGGLGPSMADGGGLTAEDAIFGNLAYGWTNGGTDSYAFSGEITAFEINEGERDPEVLVDGTPVDDPVGAP